MMVVMKNIDLAPRVEQRTVERAAITEQPIREIAQHIQNNLYLLLMLIVYSEHLSVI